MAVEDRFDRSRSLRARDYALLAGAAVLGVAGTLRSFGLQGVTLPAAGLLAGAAVAALGPLIRLVSGRELWESRSKTILAIVFACHLVGTLYFFPPEDVLNDRPVLTLDHAIHFYQVERAKEVFWRSFRLHMYDPYFMAGYPAGTIFDIDTKGAEAWCSLLRFVDTARSYKLFILMSYLLAVCTVYAGCRRLRYSSQEGIFAVLLFLAYWHWGRPYVGDFRFAGMFSYLFVCHLSLYLVGLFRSVLDGEPAKRFYVLGPLAFLIHPTAAVLLPVPFLALFLIGRHREAMGRVRGRWELRGLLRGAAWCLAVVAVNAIWLVPFFRYLDIKVPSQTFFQLEGIRGLLAVLVRPANSPAILLILLSVVGFAHLVRERRLVEAIAPGAASLFLVFLAGFGIYLPLFDQMEPGRFLVPALIFMSPLGGAGLVALMSACGGMFRVVRFQKALNAIVMITLLLCAPAFALVASRGYYRHTVSTTFTPEVARVVDALKLHTNASGRLMIEDGPAWAYGNSHLASVIPLYTAVEQIGGPYAFMFIKHGFTTFQAGRTMGVPLKEMDPGRLREYIDLYNVHWILTATPECERYVNGLPYATSLWSSKQFHLWEVSAGSTFASEPGVAVRASIDLLHVTISNTAAHATPEKILLKYHWDRGLEVASPARISKILQLNDPVPLILLEPNGARDIRITFR
jgi:hypothetical protein